MCTTLSRFKVLSLILQGLRTATCKSLYLCTYSTTNSGQASFGIKALPMSRCSCLNTASMGRKIPFPHHCCFHIRLAQMLIWLLQPQVLEPGSPFQRKPTNLHASDRPILGTLLEVAGPLMHTLQALS